MTSHPDVSQRPRRRRIVRVGVGVAAVLLVGVVTAVLVTPRTACGCAVPPDDDAAIHTAQDFTAALARGDDAAARSLLAADESLPDDDRARTLRRLAGPDTTWVVAGVHRTDDDSTGDTPAERVLAGVRTDGTWAALLVRTDTDYRQGTVVPQLPVDGPPGVLRAGNAPLFAGDNEYTTPSGTFTLVAPGGEPEPVEPVQQSPMWAYVGPGLPPDRYFMIQTVFSVISDPQRWIVHAGWYDPAAATVTDPTLTAS